MRYNKITNNLIEREFITYPFTWWDNPFTDEELKMVNDYCDTLELHKGKIGLDENSESSINTNTRNSNICFFNPTQENSWIFHRFNGVIEQLNDQFYGFDLQGYDHIQYGIYDESEQQHYNWHMDTFLGSNPHKDLMRKLSITFLLNEPNVDFEGGEFEINTGNHETPTVTETKKNRAICFPSWMIHRVKPVTKGIRKSLVIWVTGPKFR